MYNKLTEGMRLAGVIKPVLVLSSALVLSACMSKDANETSSSMEASSSVAISSEAISSEASSQAISSSSMMPSSSSVMLSSSSVMSSSSEMESSSSEMSSSSQAPQYGEIIPRTTCPKAPEMLNVLGGSWEPAFAHATDHTMDVVPNYKELMKLQPKFVTSDVSMAWALHEPFQAKGNPEALYPLVVYLHGGSEMASGQNELPFLDNRHAKSFFASAQSLLTPEHLEEKPAYIFAPFCDAKAPSGKKCAFGSAEWASNGFGAIGATLNGEGSPYGAAVEAIIEQLIATKQVDPARIYVTGPSMGGGGSWDLAGRRPDLIAAAIPLAGHPLNSNSLQTLADYKVPVWSHHGQKDNTNSYPAAQSAIASLASKGGCAWQTTYLPSQNLANDDPADADPSDATHNIWARVYTNPELWDWVFAQSQPRSGEVIEEHSSSKDSSSSHGSTSSTGTVGNPDAVLFQDDFEGDSVGSLPKNWNFYYSYSKQNPPTNMVQVVSDGNGGKAVSIKDNGQAPNMMAYEPANASSITQLYMRARVKPSRDIGNAANVNHSHFMATQITPYSSNAAEFRFGEVKKGIGIGTSQPDDLAPSGQSTAYHSTKVIPADEWSCVEVGIQTEGADKVTSWINDKLLIEINSDTPWQNGNGDEFMKDAFNLVLFGWHGFNAPGVTMLFDDIVISTERIGCGGDMQPPASSSMGSSSSTGSNSNVDTSMVLDANNHYDAPKASVAPVIDGEIDAVWADAPWMRMDVAWTGFENLKVPSGAADFSGKYKAMWTEDHVYLLFDITDDVINTSGEYWQKDTVELFVDEDQSGGPHGQDHSAFAYHISHTKNVVDTGGSIDGHIEVEIKTVGTRHIWEIKMEIYANHNGYVPAQQEAARVKLVAGKLMGFTPSYIDNDGRGREHFMSSVDTEGHQKNQGYLNADAFGSIMLVE